jgi:hypothetical protein
VKETAYAGIPLKRENTSQPEFNESGQNFLTEEYVQRGSLEKSRGIRRLEH